MSKDVSDKASGDLFDHKRPVGRPAKADALSNAERQRIFRLKRQVPKPPSVDSDALGRLEQLQADFDSHVDKARRTVQDLHRQVASQDREIALLISERGKANSAAQVFQERLRVAGLSTDYRTDAPQSPTSLE